MTKKGSIKETGEELPQDQWERFEAAVGVDQGAPKDRPLPPAKEAETPKTGRTPGSSKEK